MTKLSDTQLASMLKMQDAMNSKVNPNWILANNNWYRAIQVEGVEGIEHHGWKWWKKQDCDMAQLKMELVDIWHFILSAVIQDKQGDIVLAKTEMMKELNLHQEKIHFDDHFYLLTQMNLLEKLDLLIGLAAAKRTSMGLFESILTDCSTDWMELFKQYIGKNVLNIFRQDHGYKDGTYIKIWDGCEDNEHLIKILDIVDLQADNIRDELYQLLKTKYILVVEMERAQS